MLSIEDNRTLTDTNAGTPMGRMVRSHWIPLMLETEAPEPDDPPQRVKLLGESLVLFRDTQGRFGLLEELCPHRRASLYFGRNEECGLRCIYHGWKFDVDGKCVDLPSEPQQSTFKERVRAKSYPVKAIAGLIWVYMGDDPDAADMPHFEWFDVPEAWRYASRWMQDCNFVQAMEGEIDEAHVSFLHRPLNNPDVSKSSLFGEYFREDGAPRYRVFEAPFGMACGARRTVEGGTSYLWRINHYLLPFYTMIAPSDDQHSRVWRAWIPMDNEHCYVICVTWRDDHEVEQRELDLWRSGTVAHRRTIPGTLRPPENRDNDYLIDRDAQRHTSFSGVHGVRAQDAVVVESAGAIVDRSRENLASSDAAVSALRRRMLRAARITAAGQALETSRNGDLFAIRTFEGLMSTGVDFDKEATIMAAMKMPTGGKEEVS